MRTGAVLLMLAGLGWAQSKEQYFMQVESAIAAGRIAMIHDRIQVGVIAGEPEWARRICAAAVKCKLKRALRSKDELTAAAQRIRQVGDSCAEQNEFSADAWSAKADGLYFLLRVQRALGEPTGTGTWLAVADALVRLHEQEAEGGAPLERAVKVLREGATVKGPDAEKLKAKEDEICRAGLEEYPDNGVFASSKQNTELDAILALIGAGEYKAAKPRLAKLLAEAKDHTTYNDAVTVARTWSRKLHLKAEYRFDTREKFWGVFDVDIPRGERWKVESSSIRQYDRAGKLKRKFTFDYFKLNTLYYVGDSKYDGSNVKGMALITERDVLGVVVKVKRRSKIIKKRLNRKISRVQYFVIGGYDKDTDYVRFHSYLWKGKERDWLTYRCWIIEWEDYEDLDPEAGFVRDSLRERKYEGK
jgi:hypothetical protein